MTDAYMNSAMGSGGGRGPGHIDLSGEGSARREDADSRAMLLVIYGLYFAGFITQGFTALIGLVLAYVSRDQSAGWARSHFDYQIRTFWLGLAAVVAMAAWGMVGGLLSVVLIGIPMLVLLAPMILASLVWWGVRVAIGFHRALDRRPNPDPETLLW